jgi:hypothetical protein
VSNERRILQLVLFEKGFYIFGERSVRVYTVMWRVAVISGVDCVDGSFEDARKCTNKYELVISQVFLKKKECSCCLRILSNTLVIPLAAE